jgi:nucleoside-diphosphate-sugar epimerase
VLARTASVHHFAAFVGDGSSRLPSAHRLDVAHLFRLALEKAPAGSNLHGVGEMGVPMRAVAEEIGRQLDLPVRSIPPEDAMAHFGGLGFLVGLDLPASNALTRERLGWEPSGPGLLEDLAAGQYLNR